MSIVETDSIRPGDIEAIVTVEPIQVVLAALPLPVDVTPEGHRLATTWRAVDGATGARLTSATVAIHPDRAGQGRSLGVVAGARDDVNSIAFDSPVPDALLRAVRIPGLVRLDGEDEFPVNGSGDLGGSFHLIISPVIDGEIQAPVVAVPALPKRKRLPAQLTGGSLSGSLLTLPDIAGSSFRIQLVEGDSPEDMDLQRFHHGDVTLYAAPMPVGVHVDDPGGAEVYAMAGPLRDPVSYDVTAAVNRHLGAAATSGGPIETAVTVRSDVVGRASVGWTTAGGVVERSVDERLSIDVEGTPTSILLPPPHPGRAPTRTTADVTVAHHGMAIHPLSDPVPAVDAGVGGPTVRDTAVVRALPPEALRDQVLRRVGVIGWPRGDTDLTLTVLGQTATVTGLAAPTDREPASLVWFDVGELFVDAPIELALTATRGAFGWIADPDPIVRLAVSTTPAAERVAVGGAPIDLTGDETVLIGLALAGTDRWDVETDQFCTVSMANAVMEFAP